MSNGDIKMVVILKQNPDKTQLKSLMKWLESKGVSVHTTVGAQQTILGLVGDTSAIDIDLISALDIVEAVRRVQEPYKSANRKFHPHDTVITVGNVKIGGGGCVKIAGPGAVESEEQICSLALELKDAGADILWGGAYKSRSSPYSFQGLRADGIKYLLSAKRLTGMPVAAELTDISQADEFSDVDIIIIGARSMRNYELLRCIATLNKPVILKRAVSATYEELLMSAEYIMSGGNPEIILCERGIRTFEPHTSFTFDISAVPVLKQLSHLPVIADPSYASGKYTLVEPLTLAAAAAGADGIITAVHSDPEHAMCDGPLTVKVGGYRKIVSELDSLCRLRKDGSETNGDR